MFYANIMLSGYFSLYRGLCSVRTYEHKVLTVAAYVLELFQFSSKHIFVTRLVTKLNVFSALLVKLI